jgi:hypothetical protein
VIAELEVGAELALPADMARQDVKPDRRFDIRHALPAHSLEAKHRGQGEIG